MNLIHLKSGRLGPATLQFLIGKPASPAPEAVSQAADDAQAEVDLFAGIAHDPRSVRNAADVSLCKLSLTTDGSRPRATKWPFGYEFEPFM
jgi:hypothetical protein